MPVPDAHCHLDALADPERAVRDAEAAGVGPILSVGMRHESSAQALRLARRFPGQVLAAVGVHPSEIPAFLPEQLAAELDFVRAHLEEAAALGEVGLDFKDASDEIQRDRQRRALAVQLEWAAALHKPVSVHCRRAEREIIEICAAFRARTGLGVDLHWFTHSKKLGRRAAAAGLFISAGPSILHDASQAEVAATLDGAWLLCETDSPVEFAAVAATPAQAAQVAAHLATLRGETVESMRSRLQGNFRRYLGG